EAPAVGTPAREFTGPARLGAPSWASLEDRRRGERRRRGGRRRRGDRRRWCERRRGTPAGVGASVGVATPVRVRASATIPARPFDEVSNQAVIGSLLARQTLLACPRPSRATRPCAGSRASTAG